MIVIFAWAALAAETMRPVHTGDTVESMAEELGDPQLAAGIRELNGLAPGEQPTVGTLIRLPDPRVLGQQKAFLISKNGEVTVRDPGGAVAQAELFVPIEFGWTLCTGEEGRATVRLASTCNDDGDASDDLVMLPSTCLVVDSATSSKEGRASVIRVTKGSVGVLSQLDARGHINIVTPTGLTSSPVGGFRVTIEEDAARTETLEGTAKVAGAGAEVSLEPGQGSRVKAGETPSPPVDLLRVDTLLAPEAGALLRRPAFAWEAVDGAMGYRLEIGADEAFRELFYQEDTPGPQHAPQTLMLPYNQLDAVMWRVAAFDRFGFLGVPSEARALRFPPGLR